MSFFIEIDQKQYCFMIGHDILLNGIFYYKLNYIKCSAHSAGMYDDVVFLWRYAGNPF